MINEQFEQWEAAFFSFLEEDNKDLIGLYNERILFIPDANNQVQPKLLPLQEPYASKEQIKRMSDVFEEYLSTHPV